MLTPQQLAELIELNAYAVTFGYDFVAEPDEETYQLYEKSNNLATRLVNASGQILALAVDELKLIDSNVNVSWNSFEEVADQLYIHLTACDRRLKTTYGKALEDKFTSIAGGPRIDTMSALATALEGVSEAKTVVVSR